MQCGGLQDDNRRQNKMFAVMSMQGELPRKVLVRRSLMVDNVSQNINTQLMEMG